MTSTLPRVAVDTCVVVDLLTNEDPAHAENARYLLDGHDRRHTVVLPAIVIAEIAGAPKIRGDNLKRRDKRLRVRKAQEWIAASGFYVAELSERIARQAAKYAIDYQLKGADSAVLATAVHWKCAKLYTRDSQLLSCDGKVDGLSIIVPELPPEPSFDLFGERVD